MIVRKIVALLRDSRGGPAIEFALIAPLLFTLVLGAVDVGRMFYVRQSLEYSTEQAARYFSLNPTAATSDVTSYLQGQMSDGMGSSILVNYTDTTGCNGQTNITCTLINATYNFTFIAGYLGLGNLTLRAKAQAVRVVS